MALNANRPAVPSFLTPTLLAFIGFVILAGGASVAIRFTYAELPTFWGAAARFGLAGLVFWLLVVVRKVALPRGRALLGAALFGALSVGGFFIFVYWGLEETPASLYQIVSAVVPLLTLFFAFFHRLERLQIRGLIGATLAIAGIAVAFGGSVSGEVSILRLLAIIAGAACFAEAGVIAKQFPRSHPIATNAVAMTVGTVMIAIVSLLAGEAWVLPTSAGMWWAFGYLVIGASVLPFLLFLYVLGRWSASATSYGFVLVPLVTVVLATSLAGERITWLFVLGGLLVLAGVWFGALMPTGARAGTGAEKPPATSTNTVSTSTADA